MKKVFALLSAIVITGTIWGQEARTDTIIIKELDGVVVTGQYKPQSVRNSVYQVKVINNERIRISGAANIQQVLSQQLGFRFSNDNTLGTSDVELLGMGGRNVKILLDGVPMTDRGDTRESLNQVDINMVDRIEIIEGPMSVSYGSDALAGVINIITRKNIEGKLSVTANTREETVGNEYHPFNYKGSHSQHAAISVRHNKWNTTIGGTHNEFDGSGGDAYGRNKNWKPKEQWLGDLKLGYANDVFNIYYRLDALTETIINRGAINMDNYKAIDKSYKTGRIMHQVQSGWHINNDMQVNSLIAYTDYNRKTTTTRHDFEKNTDQLTTGEAEQDRSTFKSLVFRTTLQYKLSSRISFQPGIEINRESAGGARIKGSPVITDYALFVSSEIRPTDKINIRPGLRFIKNTVYDAPPVIPSINTKITLSKLLDLRLAYAYGFRAPALRELYFDFHDTNHDIIGNPELQAEHSNSFSGSLSATVLHKVDLRLTTKLEAFYNVFNDLINYAQNPVITNQFITVNIDKFKTTGLGLENNLQWRSVEAGIGFAYTGRYNSFSNDPAHTSEDLPSLTWTPEFNSSIIYSVKKIGGTVGLFYKFTGARPGYRLFYNNNTGLDEVQLTKTSSFHWADLTITKTLCKRFTVTGGVKNLFDVSDLNNTAYASGTVHSQGGAVPAGYRRSYFLGLSFQWSKIK